MSSQLAMFPLSTVLFPHAVLTLHVFETRYRAMVKECLEDDATFGVVLISRGSEVGGGEMRSATGTAVRIERARTLPDGRSILLVRGRTRFQVLEWLADDPYPRGNVAWLEESPPRVDPSEALAAAEAAVQRARALLSELEELPPSTPGPRGAGVEARSWWLCDQAPLSAYDRQRLLECDDPVERLRLVAGLAGSVADDLAHLLRGG